jgi:hypothetical protein
VTELDSFLSVTPLACKLDGGLTGFDARVHREDTELPADNVHVIVLVDEFA